MKLDTRIAIALSLLVSLAACNDDAASDDEVGTESTADDPTTTNDDPTTTDDDPTSTTDDPTEGGENFCAHQCSADSDCTVGGMDIGLTCQDSFCTGESSGCTNDDQCVAQLSGWTTACTSGGGECDALAQLCVQVGDGGLCATPPSDFFSCDTVPGWAELEVPDIDGNTVTVCGNANAECNDEGFCFSPCQSDADCASDAYPICNTDTGLCGCGEDAHCATLGLPHLSVCSEGSCGCGSDQNCIDGEAGDVCTSSGFCGCSGDAACSGVTNSFDGGMISCVGG